MSSAATRRQGPGRPRHIEPLDDHLTPREQILGAAARLFTRQGFAATSTRMIAEEVGIRQASLYYHFTGKDDILGELLERTVRPTLDSLDKLDQQSATPEARLYMLALRDARVLAELDHNIGTLPTHPDVTNTDVYQEYEAARQQLRAAYGRLGIACASEVVISTVTQHQLGWMIFQQVEGVVRARAEDGGKVVPERDLRAVAATCLRICGVAEDRAEAAAVPPSH